MLHNLCSTEWVLPYFHGDLAKADNDPGRCLGARWKFTAEYKREAVAMLEMLCQMRMAHYTMAEWLEATSEVSS